MRHVLATLERPLLGLRRMEHARRRTNDVEDERDANFYDVPA
jgi:hypothetical protein